MQMISKYGTFHSNFEDRKACCIWLQEIKPLDDEYQVGVLHVQLTELHAAHQNPPPAIRTLRLKKPYKIYTKNERNLTI